MTILLVDDDIDELILFNDAIQEIDEKITFMTSTNGERCLEMLQNITPDFIFLDINMPKMSGKDCLTILKATDDLKHIPVIMYSTTVSPADAEFFKQLGIPFKRKPTKFEDLVSFVKETVARK